MKTIKPVLAVYRAKDRLQKFATLTTSAGKVIPATHYMEMPALYPDHNE